MTEILLKSKVNFLDLKSDGYGVLCEEYESALGFVDSWFRGQKLEMIFESYT